MSGVAITIILIIIVIVIIVIIVTIIIIIIIVIVIVIIIIIAIIIFIIMLSGGAVQVAVLYGLPAERGVAKSKGDDDDHESLINYLLAWSTTMSGVKLRPNLKLFLLF